MNKIITTDVGGMPLKLNDLRFIDEAYRLGFYGILSSFGITAADSYKLSGCVVTLVGTTFSCTAGYISLAGEVYQVDAHSLTVSSLLTYTAIFAEDLSWAAAGLKLFKSLTSYNTYMVRKAKLVAGILEYPSTHMRYNAMNIHQVINAKLQGLEESWHLVGGSGEPVFSDGWSNIGGTEATVGFKKDIFNTVYLKGVSTNTHSEVVVFKLPTGYRPLADMSFSNAYNDELICIKVCSNGNVEITTATPVNVSLCGISFKIN